MRVKEWGVKIFISEDGSDTVARAVLVARDTASVVGIGRTRRNPIDRDVPEIGDEVAVSRALADLAERLHFVASDDIAARTGPADVAMLGADLQGRRSGLCPGPYGLRLGTGPGRD